MASSRDQEYEFLDEADLQDYNDAGLLPQSPKVISEIHDWLQPTAYNDGTSEYLRHLTSHVHGTGDWLAETEEYRQWHDNDRGNVLWIKAVPGAGKSVLAAHCRARIFATERIPALHFFFRQIITANQTPVQLTRDWVAQLLVYSPLLQKRIKDSIIDKNRTLENVGLDEFWQMLCEALAPMPRVYCFVDALDEMTAGHEDFLIRLIELSIVAPCKVFLTSRPVPRIVEKLRTKPILQITLGPDNMSEDISTYVDNRLEHDIVRYVDHRLRTSGLHLGDGADDKAAIEQLVRSTLKQKSQGSFLYAKLIMDNLLEAIHKADGGYVSPNWIRDTLNALPTGLTEMYGDMLRDHAQRTGTSQDLQLKILRWVTHSERPLRLLELSTAIDFQEGTISKGNRDTKTVLRQACGPLLEIMPSDVVGPIHHSFTEFLITATNRPTTGSRSYFPEILFAPAHEEIAEICLLYLIHVFDHDGTIDQTLDELKLKFPFFDYAIYNWASHVNKCGEIRPRLISVLDRYVTNNKSVQNFWERTAFSDGEAHRRWNALSMLSGEDEETKREMHIVTPLHIAAWAGLADYIAHLAQLGHDVEATDIDGQTALHFAARNGSADGVISLLDIGANNNPADGSGLTPLHHAASNGHTSVIDVLVRSGVSPQTPKTRENPSRRCGNAPRTTGLTPMDFALDYGRGNSVTTLLKYIDKEDVSNIYSTALLESRGAMAKLIASDARFDPNQKINGQTPLCLAANSHNLECMGLLLSKGALPSTVSKKGGLIADRSTPLHAFITSNEYRTSEEVLLKGVEMLIQAGCPVDAVEASQRTALCYAQENLTMIKFLVANGADPQAVVRCGSNPLHEIGGFDKDAMKLWIDLGLDINSRDSKGRTPLTFIFTRDWRNRDRSFPLRTSVREKVFSFQECVKNLLELGADPNLSLSSGDSPLHLAAASDFFLSNEEEERHCIVNHLIEAGADVNAQNQEGVTPLMLMPHTELERVLPLYLNAGVDLMARDNKGRTAAFGHPPRNSVYQHGDPVSLVKAGFGINDRDSSGATILHLNAMQPKNTLDPPFRERVQKYAEAKADIEVADHLGNTVCHYVAIADGGAEVGDINALIEFGVDPTKANLEGQTPLHFAASRAQSSTVVSLLKVCPTLVDKADLRSIMPLHLAAATSTDIVMNLLRMEANLFAYTRDGQTVLHFAAVARRVNVLCAVMSYLPPASESFVNRRDEHGKTALYYAARSGLPESVKVLLENGADPNLADLKNRTPLNACSEFPGEEKLWSFPSDADCSVSTVTGSGVTSHKSGNGLCILLKSGWENIARKLGKASNNAPEYHRISIRACARHLMNSGAPVVRTVLKALPKPVRLGIRAGRINRASQTRIKGPIKQEDTSVFLDAVNARCEPLVDELLDTFEESYKGKIHWISQTGLYIKHVKQAREDYLNLIKQEGKDCTSQMAEYFVEIDYEQFFAKLLDAGLNVRSNFGFNRSSVLDSIINQGCHIALECFASQMGDLTASPRRLSSEEWPNVAGGREFEEILNAPLDGLLKKACSRNDWNMDVVRIIVEKIGCSDFEKTLVLFDIARSSNWWTIDAMKYLVRNGANVNARRPTGETPLFWACQMQKTVFRSEQVKCLLNIGADPNILDGTGTTCLYRAADDVVLRDMLLAHGADPQIGSPRLIMRAIEIFDVDLVRMLIERGCELDLLPALPDNLEPKSGQNFKDARSRRCLHHALLCAPTGRWRSAGESEYEELQDKKQKHSEIIKILLANGADPFATTEDNSPLLHLMLERGKNTGPILDTRGLNLEYRDSKGRTLLLAEASSRFCSTSGVFKCLLERGANIEAIDNNGNTALHLLLQARDDPSSMERICEHSSCTRMIETKNAAGWLPMQLLMANNRWHFAQLLADHGARFDGADPDGNTAFHHLLSEKCVRSQAFAPNNNIGRLFPTQTTFDSPLERRGYSGRSIAFLRRKGVDINELNHAGWPALFNYLESYLGAAPDETSGPGEDSKPGVFAVQLRDLIDVTGADVHLKSRDGITALHVVAEHQSEDRFLGQEQDMIFTRRLCQAWRLLVDEYGLDPWAEDAEHRSALDVAAACGNTGILEMY